MPESFGARLRRHRQEQGIALTSIAEQTKIKLSLLEALERDDVKQWPSGIFRRAFIRAYAHAIGLDPDVIVREFLEAFPEPDEIFATAAIAAAAEGARSGGRSATRLLDIVGSAIGSLSKRRRPDTADVPASFHAAPASVPSPADTGLEAMAVWPPTAPLAAPSAEPPVGPPAETVLVEAAKEIVDAPSTSTAVALPAPDWTAVARLCTDLGRVDDASEAQRLLQDAAGILDATGLIVWAWDGSAAALRPALACGYSDKVLAQVPAVRPDADNATAAAFRSAQTCAIAGSDQTTGALVVPLLTPEGCAGVLALELQDGGERNPSIRAAAMIIGALLAQLMGGGQVRSSAEADGEASNNSATPVAPPAY